MLKPILKLVFAIATLLLIALSYPNLAIVAAFGFAVLSAVDVWNTYKIKTKEAEEEGFTKKRKLRDILNDFRANFSKGLIELEVIKDKSDLTYERIYELSQDSEVIELLEKKGFTRVINELEDFSRLYEPRI